MRTDVMVDIETLGTSKGSAIFQIAAVAFDITTGQIKDKTNVFGDIAMYRDLQVDGATLKWWLETDAELLRKLLSDERAKPEVEMIIAFLRWIHGLSEDGSMKDVYLWGNGILFDNAKISDLCDKVGLNYPINYKNDRDVRTLLELASLKSGISENQLRDEAQSEDDTLHDAYDDCLRQIRLATRCFNIIKEGE